MHRTALLRFVVIFVSSVAVLSVFFHFVGMGYVRGVVPLISVALRTTHADWIDSEVRLKLKAGHEALVLKTGIPAGTIFRNGMVQQRVKRSEVSVDPALLYVQPVIVLSLLAGWPWMTVRDKFRALGIAVPCMLFVSALDASVRLADFAAQGVPPASAAAYFRGYVNYFMGNGGRQFMAVVVFLISIAPFHLYCSQEQIENQK